MALTTPFFSIIIPTYNRAGMISGAIQSVLGQTFESWELIIIDDGSNDETADVVSKFNDQRIKYTYQQNTERSQARNNGINMASGTYICFLDSDDQYCNNHLQVFYKYVSENNFPITMLFTNPILIKGKNEVKEQFPSPSDDDTLSYILHHSIIPDRVCVHHSILQKYKFNPAVHIGEDAILWARITNEYPMKHINEYTIKYCIHDDNSVNLKNNVYRYRLIGLLELFNEPEIKQRLNTKLKNQIISVCYFGIARHYELKRKFCMMFLNALLSVGYDFKNPQTKSKLYMIYNYFSS